MVVDDSKASLELFEIFMGKQGFHVVSCVGAEAALSTLTTTKPDIIVLDVVMPGIDGFKLCSLLRQRPDTKTTPIVFLTSTAGEIQRERVDAVGGNDIVAKPFEAPKLAAHLRQIMRAAPS